MGERRGVSKSIMRSYSVVGGIRGPWDSLWWTFEPPGRSEGIIITMATSLLYHHKQHQREDDLFPLQMQKPRAREIKWPSQAHTHTVEWWQNQHSSGKAHASLSFRSVDLLYSHFLLYTLSVLLTGAVQFVFITHSPSPGKSPGIILMLDSIYWSASMSASFMRTRMTVIF